MSTTVIQKINGFSKQPSLQQTLTFIIYGSNILIYYFIYVQKIEDQILQILLSLLFGISTLVLGISCFICTSTDPTDPCIAEQKIAQFQQLNFDDTDLPLYCSYCNLYVSEEAKHCKVCDRCVNVFDHHCQWMNNCVGIQNKKSFLIMIHSLIVYEIIFLSVAIYQVQYGIVTSFAHYIVVSYNMMILMLDTNLVLFHQYLIYKKLTTYKWIQMQRQKELSKRNLQSQEYETPTPQDQKSEKMEMILKIDDSPSKTQLELNDKETDEQELNSPELEVAKQYSPKNYVQGLRLNRLISPNSSKKHYTLSVDKQADQ